MLRFYTEDDIIKMNEALPKDVVFKFIYDDSTSYTAIQIKLKDSTGLDSYIINITDEMANWIEEYNRKTFNCGTGWNNTRSCFWLRNV